MSERRDEIRTYTAEHFGRNLAEGGLSVTIRDLRIDSLDLVEFLMTVEEKFGVEIDPDEIDPRMTLEQFCQVADKSK